MPRSRAFPLAALALLCACPGSPGVLPRAALDAPRDVTLTAGRDILTVAWTPVEGATGYAIYWGVAGFELHLDSRRTVAAAPFTLTGLMPRFAYSVAVAATNADGEGPWSELVTAQAGLDPPILSALPGDSGVLITWEPLDGDQGVYIRRAEADEWGRLPASPAWFVVTTTGTPTDYAVDTNVVNGKTYLYQGFGWETRDSAAVPATPRHGETACATLPATAVTATSAKLRGLLLNPPGRTSTASFEHGETAARGGFTSVAATAVAGPAAFSVEMGSLAADSDLHYRFGATNSDGTCAGGDRVVRTWRAPEVLASGLWTPIALALGPEALYFAEGGSGRIASVPKSGGTPQTVVAANAPAALVWHASELYAADASGVHRIHPAEPSKTTLHHGAIRLDGHVLDVAGSSLYWRHSADGVYRLSMEDGSVTLVHGAQGITAAVDDTGVYWTDGAAIRKLPLDAAGALPLTLATEVGGVGGDLLVADRFVYFRRSMPNALLALARIPIDGGPQQVLTVSGARPLAIDATHVYWVEEQLVRKVPVDGGPVTTLAYSPNVHAPDRGTFAVDGTHVYWVAKEDPFSYLGSIVRVPKD